MVKEITLNVPSTQSNIPLKNYQKYIKLIQDNGEDIDDDFLGSKMIEIFCGVTLKDAYSIPLKEFEFVISHLITIINEEAKLQRTFTMTDPNGNTVEFGFIPNIDEISLGEYVDLENYISDWSTMHKALAVMYRPVVVGRKEFYDIEPYEGSDKYSEIMKDAPMTVALGATVFFYNLGKELLKTTMDSFQVEMEEMESYLQSQPLELNGDGINQSMHYLKETLGNLTKLRNLAYINA